MVIQVSGLDIETKAIHFDYATDVDVVTEVDITMKTQEPGKPPPRSFADALADIKAAITAHYDALGMGDDVERLAIATAVKTAVTDVRVATVRLGIGAAADQDVAIKVGERAIQEPTGRRRRGPLMGDVIYEADYRAKAVGYLLSQYQTSPRLVAFLEALATGAQYLEEAAFGVWVSTRLTTASGDALDQWGPWSGRSVAASQRTNTGGLFRRVSWPITPQGPQMTSSGSLSWCVGRSCTRPPL